MKTVSPASLKTEVQDLSISFNISNNDIDINNLALISDFLMKDKIFAQFLFRKLNLGQFLT